ncbi:MAG: PilN domain-containing protein, partial [Tepidisphaeraceae bacterium]
RNQDRVESSLGLNVEASRVLALLSNALPPAASITELSIDTDEHQRPLLQQVVSKVSTPAIPDRRLVVTSKCVAPANIDVAAFLENLTNSGLCEDLRLDYAKEKVADGAVMREFEVAFRINLNCEGDAQ